MIRNLKLIFLAAVIALLCSSKSQAAETTPVTPLEWAQLLVRNIQPANSGYQHKQNVVTWKGQHGATEYTCHADCSGFISALFEQAYDLSPHYIADWLGKRRPVANTYHKAIAQHNGFKRIERIQDAEPGDIIAIRYPPGSKDTGHMMLIAEKPQPQIATKPEVMGTTQWQVRVIDSTGSGHGNEDTRHNANGTFNGGVGEGTFRIYADQSGKIMGYTWSPYAKSVYYDQTQRHLVIGRPALPTKPQKLTLL